MFPGKALSLRGFFGHDFLLSIDRNGPDADGYHRPGDAAYFFLYDEK